MARNEVGSLMIAYMKGEYLSTSAKRRQAREDKQRGINNE